jgi:hypothetical protein
MAIKLTPLRSTLGAELRGVDLTRPVTHEVFAEIDAASNRHGIVFPEQPVSDEQQLAFSRIFRAARGQSELREWRLVGRPGRFSALPLDDGSGAILPIRGSPVYGPVSAVSSRSSVRS